MLQTELTEVTDRAKARQWIPYSAANPRQGQYVPWAGISYAALPDRLANPCPKGTKKVSALSLSASRWKWSAGWDRMLPTRSSFLSSLHVYCGMAFPVPLHLPKKQPSDVSSAILNRISDADPKTLSAALAQSWIADLEQSIRAAKVSPCSTLRSLWSLNSFPATHP